MKIRTGFVSNSSSASYIVKIKDIDFEDFISSLKSNPESFYYKYFSLPVLEDKLKRLEEMSKKYAFYNIEDLRKSFDKIDADDYSSIIKFALAFYKIGCRIKSDGIELVDVTSMHNDYDSGMSGLMKEITLHFLFETDYKLVCKIETD